jgi:hypothetical protein
MVSFHPNRSAGWTRAAIVLTGLAILLLWLTGLVLYAWPSADIAELDPARAEVRRWAVVIHGSLVWVAIFLAGRWAWPHVGAMWRRPHSLTWWAGIATLTLLLVATCTGMTLLYGPAALHDWTASGHWWCSLAIPAFIAWHAKGLVQRRRAGTVEDDSDWS